MSDPFLDLQGLTLGYGGKVAVQDLDLALAEGELVALLGPSGCGKTTTMRSIAGLLRPMGGRIVLAGQNVTRVPPNRRKVGLVFQSYALFPHLSVFENVAFGLRMQRTARAALKTRVDEALARVGLEAFAARLPRELSGGQQQRVALARAVVVRPRLLLLDEPLSNLDARLRLEMRSELRRLQRELGITMLYVTHDQHEALALADRVVVMRDGRIEQSGPPETIHDRPATAFVARFMGFENVFRVSGDRLLGDGNRSVVWDGRSEAPWIAWRPQTVQLGQGAYVATVAGVSYLGQTVEYLLETPLGPIKAEVESERPRWPVGAEVVFDLPEDKAVHIPGGEA